RQLAWITWSGGLVLASACGGGSASSCRNTVLSRTMSPGAELEAIVFNHVCGAPIGHSTQISIVPAGMPLHPSEAGNLFAMETELSVTAVGAGGEPAVRTEWIGRNRLLVRHDHRGQVVKAVGSIAAVRIEYLVIAPDVPDTVVVRSGELELHGLLWTP